jgi:hypothetical protein
MQMTKRRKAYKPKSKSIPMLVNRMVHANVESIEERTMLLAFSHNVATKQHYDYLLRLSNFVQVAYQIKPCEFLEIMQANFIDIATRANHQHETVGDYELDLITIMRLRQLVNDYDVFWKRQTTDLYNQCAHNLNAFYAERAAEEAAA